MPLLIPKWLAAHERQVRGLTDQLQEQGKSGVMSMRTSQREAGWVDDGMEFSCIPDAVNPWDPEVLKAIWTFDPGAIPLWIRWKFRRFDGANTEVQVFGRHGIGRYTANPHADLPCFACTMPSMPCQGVKFEKPNLIELILMKNDSKDDSPGSFVPWNWDLFNFLRSRYKERTAKETMQVVQDKLDREEKEKQRLREQWVDAMKDIQKYTEKKMEQAGEVELKRHLLSAGQRPRNTKVSVVIDPTKLGPTPSAGPVTLR
jgi:hypothetical protein